MVKNKKLNRAIISFMSAAVALVSLYLFIAGNDMKVLFGNLSDEDLGRITIALDKMNEEYKIQNNSIFVSENKKDKIRLDLAGAGVLSSNVDGYSLLDSLPIFGTSNQMFQATYVRAIEGELSRTISSSQKIESARVHIAYSPDPRMAFGVPTATVAIIPKAETIDYDQAKAISHLVAASIPNMKYDAVSVINLRDDRLISIPDSWGVSEKYAIENKLKQSVLNILERYVGAGNAEISVSVELDHRKTEVSERKIFPQDKTSISSSSEEKASNNTGGGVANVTVASNVPNNQQGNGGQYNSTSSENRQVSNFDISQSVTQTSSSPGQIKRLSVAAIVDGITTHDATTNSETWAPRSQDEMNTLKELIEGAIGFDSARGDVIKIASLKIYTPHPFMPSTSGQGDGWFSLNYLNILEIFSVLVIFVISIFVLR